MSPADSGETALAALAALSLEQRAALERLLEREDGGPEAGLAPITPRADRSELPLSFAQQRLWFLDQLSPGDAAYNIHGAVRLRGSLRFGALASSLRTVTARHEVLRSRFAAVEGRPEQSLAPAGGPPLPAVDLGGLGEERRRAEVLRLALEEARRPFDLARGPLLRTALLRLGSGECVLLVTMHHIVSDGWSLGVFVREMTALYAGSSAPLPALPFQYADFAAWQRKRMAGHRLAAEVDHWRSRLAGVPALSLPEELSPERSAGSVPVVLAAGLVERLREVARTAGASLFMVLLAAFEAVLLRWSGQRDFAVGTPIANRNRPEIEGLIGFFVNTLVLRTDLAGDPPFRGLLERVRDACLDAYAHQDLPFEKLVEELQPERRLGRNPLFSALFALQNAPQMPLAIPGLDLELLPVRNGTARFDLALDLAEGNQGITGSLAHGPAGLSPLATRRMAGHFLALLEAAAASPGRPLSELPLLTAVERHQILVEWAGAEEAVPEAGFSALLAAQAARSPDEVAVVCGGEALTYRELARRSNQLAHHLRRLGAGPEAVVALALERSLDMVVGLFAILGAGAAYLPIDPDNLLERQSFMLEDCGAAVLLTRERWAGSFRRLGLHVLCLDSDRAVFGGEPETAPPPLGGSGNALAYLYTSGSTGRPKATVVEERGFLNLCHWFRRACGFSASTRALLGFAFSFDAAFKNIVVPLLAGGRLVLAGPGPFDAAEVLAAIREEGVTFLNTTPSQMLPVLALAAGEGFAGLAGLEGLILGGEAAAWGELRPWLASGRCHGTLANMYGPSECSDTVTSHRVAPAGIIAGTARMPVGRAAANVRLVVVDADLQPLPAGVPGELCAAGICLARGYFARPELTAERFIPDPFAPGGGRMYRTGDLARWLPDGTLELLGRLDDQVKIRGVRVEPAEVEAALREHPGVRGAVVLPRAVDESGEKRLVAWIVAEGAPELRAFLESRLPAAMIPAAFVFLPEIPLNARGKLDRAALPDPEPEMAAPRDVSGQGGQGSDPAEELMAALFAAALGRPRVGVDENFFHLGGHSLLATRLVSRVRAAFGAEIPVRSLFEAPTPARLAAAVRRLGHPVPAAPPLRRRTGGSPAPLSLAQQRLWVLHQLTPGLAAYHIPAALRLRGALDPGALERALAAITGRHAALRTHFPATAETSGEPVQEVDPPSAAALRRLPLVDLSALAAARSEQEARRVAQEEARRPFDLERGPLLRLGLLRLGAADHLLLITVQHLVSDGLSAAVFLRELSLFYAAFAAGRTAELPELPVQYTDYAAWQRGWLRGEALEALLGYWRERLAGVPWILDLPTDRPRPLEEAHAAATVPLCLAAPLADSLRALARTAGATLYMVLLAGFQAVLGRWAGEESVSVGTPVSGRDRLETEELIGFFVNTLVIHTDLAGTPAPPSSLELIGRVREAVLGAFAHQHLPFEKLVEALNPERDPRWSPLVQVLFAFQSVPPAEPRLPGLVVERLESDPGAAQFDLTASLVEQAAGVTGVAGSLRYRTGLWNGTTMRRLVEGFEVLLAAMAAEPGRPAAELPLLSPAARHQVLLEWSGAEAAGRAETAEPGETPDSTLPALVAAQALRVPDRAAVVLDGAVLTYAELDRRAGRAALALRRLGVGPEVRVAICLERSPDLITAILGVLKAGGAYVPLDPAAPRERLELLLDDAAPAVLLTAAAPGGSPATEVPVLTLEEAVRPPGAPELPLPPDRPAPDQLAYVIYTSGSTGRPKGTLVRHGALGAFARGLVAAVAELRAPAPLRLSLNAPFAFDASLQQIVQLAAGHTLWIVPAEARRDGDPMAAFLRAAGLDGVDCTPSQLELILAAMDASGHPPRFVLVGGEAIAPALWERLAAHPHTRFYNVYGPTECTVDATARRIDGNGGPDIGRPLAGYRACLLDFAGQPVPAGARGEIWIGGAALARGYWQRPDLTADRFRPDPFGGAPGSRLYRTGDLGRWLPEGGIESLGRADQQIKLRGFRIEPGEIEAVLTTHPDVGESAAGLRQGRAGEPRLVAWVTPAAASRPPSARELRRWLADRLPEPMVPAAVVVLAALPRTASGKLDRRALPDPPRERPSRDPQAGPPVGDLLPRLLDLWREVLGVPEVHPEDSLFDLGGHSLSIARLVTRIADTFGVLLPARTLFISPTPQGIAEALRTAGRAAGRLPRIVRIPRGRPDSPIPLSFAQQRLWMLHQLSPGLTAYHLPAALRLRGPLGTAALTGALTEIVRRHEALRTRFPVRASRSGEEPVQEIDPAGPVPLPEIDLTALPAAGRAAEAGRIGTAETARRFDLAAGPLLRLRLVRLGADDRILLLVIHHLVSDGWSAAIFLRELAVLYAAFSQGEPSPLPELPVQYADYTVAQREWDSGILTLQLRYWTDHLTGSPQRLDLPTDRPRPVHEDDRGAAVAFHLEPGLVAGLRGLGRATRTAAGEGATLYMVLLAAFQALLARYTGQPSVNVGTPVARRSRQEIESLIGFFVNTLVLRADLGDFPTGRALAGRVRDTVLDAFAHQDLPFERLVEALHPDRDPRWMPLFQAVFALHNVPREEPHLAGLEVTRLDPVGLQAVQVDLVAAVAEEDGGGARGSLAYRTALFTEATVRRLADHYIALLAALVADPDRPVADLPILGEAERFQIVHEWSGAHGIQLLDARHQPVPAGARGVVWAGGQPTGYFARWSAAGRLEPLAPPSPLRLSAEPPRSPRTAGAAEPPGGTREAGLLALVREVLGVPDATLHDDFFELGGHSLAAWRLAVRAREALGVRLPVREIFAAPTVAELAARLNEMLDEVGGGGRAGLVIALQPRGTRPPFFCLPPGGGGVSPYRELALRLEADRPFLALRAPGLEEGEEPLRDLGALAGAYLAAIRQAQPAGPWHLGGWSSGAALAFEVARRLRAAGGEVAALVLIDPPGLPLPATEPDEIGLLAAFAREAGADGSAGLERPLAVFRANAEALRGYMPEAWSGPLTLIEAAERPAPAAAWRALATAAHVIPGSHSTVLQPPGVDELVRWVRKALEEV